MLSHRRVYQTLAPSLLSLLATLVLEGTLDSSSVESLALAGLALLP